MAWETVCSGCGQTYATDGHADGCGRDMAARALAAFERHNPGTAGAAVEMIKHTGKHPGTYAAVRVGDEVAAVYKVIARFGAPRMINGAAVVDSVAFGLKPIKRAPVGLIA